MPIQTSNRINTRDVLKGGFTQNVFEWIGTSYLGIAGPAESEWIEVLNFSQFVGSIISDVDGTAYFEFSSDAGTTVTHVETVGVSGGVATSASGITVCCTPGVARIRYVNGGVGQTSFKLAIATKRST